MANSSSTATDVPRQDEDAVDPAKAAAFKLDPYMVALLWQEPFFAVLMRQMDRVRDDKFPTAGVTVKNGSPTLIFNGGWLSTLEDKRILGLLKHEAYHLVYRHVVDRRKAPHRTWNYATDLAINGLLDPEELPKGGLFPGKPLTIKPEVLAEMTPEQQANFKALSDLIESFPVGKASEWYFSRLNQPGAHQGEGGLGGSGKIKIKVKGGKGQGQPGGGSGDMEVEVEIVDGTDSHDGWDDIPEDEREIAKGKLKEALGKAQRHADNNNSWGTVPAEIREEIRRMVAGEVDWKAVLRNFVGMRQRARRSHTMKRIHRKYPYIHPGSKVGHTSNIAIYVDQSGSVSDEWLGMAFGALEQLSRLVTFHVYPFDTEVVTKEYKEWKKGRKLQLKRVRAGGTDFKAACNHAHANRDKYDGYIVITDGGCSDPGPALIRRCWVLVPGTELYFTASPNDVVVKMKAPLAHQAA
jgi:predicted metal-dependent peptidase